MCVLLLVVCLFAPMAMADWRLDVTPAESSDGVFRLHWDGPGAGVTLQESMQKGFTSPRSIYAGEDRASLVSGKSDGIYHYRLLDADGVVVATTTATVAHHPLARAWMFFSIGLVVFIATILLVARGPGSVHS